MPGIRVRDGGLATERFDYLLAGADQRRKPARGSPWSVDSVHEDGISYLAVPALKP